jgi:hypothetical protein
MVITEKTIPFKYKDSFRIIVISDPHLGARAHVSGYLQKIFRQYRDDKKAYFLFLGDLLDCIITTDSKRFVLDCLDDNLLKKDSKAKRLNAIVDNSINAVVKLIRDHGIQDRIIGFVSGNHEECIADRHGTDPIARICDILGCENLGYSFMFKLRFALDAPTRKALEIWLYGHHGWGGGARTEGADITKFSKVYGDYPEADIYLFGHVHKKQSWMKHPVYPIKRNNEWTLEHKKKLFCICGTALKTLSDGAIPTYAEKKGYAPTPIDFTEITLSMPKHGEDRNHIDYNVTH